MKLKFILVDSRHNNSLRKKKYFEVATQENLLLKLRTRIIGLLK